MKQIVLIVVIAAVMGAVVGSMATAVVGDSLLKKSQNDLIKEFYDVENAAHVSPHSLRSKMDKGINDYILVDLRSAEEYQREHIIGAVNIPAYKDKDTSDYGAVDRIVNSFKELQKNNPGKDIITYCYSTPCMTGRKIGKMLADNGIYVKTLNIGWNEWRYFWTLWNHEHEWNQTNVMDYVATGSEPGVPKIKNSTSVCQIGEFSC